MDRLTFTLNRDSFERELDGLGYAAYKEGRALILSGKYPRLSGDTQSSTDSLEQETSEPLFLQPGQLRTIQPVASDEAKLNLPENWQIAVPKPIIYQASGFCGGGTVELLIGELKYTYALKSPTCDVVLQK